MRLSLGTDPEFMLCNEKGDIKSAIGIINGTKENRINIGKHQFYYDNVLAECAVAPGKNKAEAIDNIRSCLAEFAKLVKPNRLLIGASHVYDDAELQHEDALLIGCMPEICVYKLAMVKPQSDLFKTTNLRTAGGHIHLGYDAIDEFTIFDVVRMLDLFLGIPSVYMDDDKTRRKIYGQAGRFRETPYGVEYRPLSNFWLGSPQICDLVFDICHFAVEFVLSGKVSKFWNIDKDTLRDEEQIYEPGFDRTKYHVCSGYDVESLKKAINTTDLKLADSFLPLIKENMPAKLYDRLSEQLKKQKYDLYKEWGL
jgi:hypothetical protein